ncbi:hypothetical protein TorRG33x02_144500 [Trema orientale]|uniref:Uncharacterized protein n=1 Tax=Trema orientale TaxID=63057 RepID=A0A2P5EW60_TREOI|nr:hypothetical protein TorRG33x02_144500 [Trema orientale]
MVNCLPRLYRLASSKNEIISSLRRLEHFISSGRYSWSLGFSQSLSERELEEVSNLILALEGVRCHVEDVDKRVWHSDKSGRLVRYVWKNCRGEGPLVSSLSLCFSNVVKDADRFWGLLGLASTLSSYLQATSRIGKTQS